MTKQVQEAYIAAATRTPAGKATRGRFSNPHPEMKNNWGRTTFSLKR